MTRDRKVLTGLEEVHRLLLAPSKSALRECEEVLGSVIDHVQGGAPPDERSPAIRSELKSIAHLLETARGFYQTVFGFQSDSLAQYSPDGALRVHDSRSSFAVEV